VSTPGAVFSFDTLSLPSAREFSNSMHPPLFKAHPECDVIISKLVACHEEYKLGKFLGACNDVKAELDMCLMREKIMRRDANLKKAREFDRKFEAYLAKKNAAKSDGVKE
jgi:hypothetical protein